MQNLDEIASGTSVTPYDGAATIKLEGSISLPSDIESPEYTKTSLQSILATLNQRKSLLSAEALYLKRYLQRYASTSSQSSATRNDSSPLQLQVKLQLASRDFEDFRDWVNAEKRKGEKEMKQAELVLDDVENATSEVRKVMTVFGREVVQTAPEGKLPCATKVLKFLEDELSMKDNTAGKLRLRTSTLKRQVYKLQLALKQKEGSGEVMHAIDFEKLQIEKAQQTRELASKNGEMLELKGCSARLGQALSLAKRGLGDALDERDGIRLELADKRMRCVKLCGQIEMIGKETQMMARELIQLTNLSAKWKVPSTLEYAKLKISVREIERKTRHLREKR